MSARPAWFGQLARFGGVGAVTNLALYGVYLVATALGLSPEWATTLCFALGIPISLRANARLTFRADHVPAIRKAQFVTAYLLAYFVQLGVLSFLYKTAGIPHQIAQLCAMGTVAILLFLFQKFVVFRD